MIQFHNVCVGHKPNLLSTFADEQAASRIKLPKTLLKSLIYPLHCSFYKLVLVGRHEKEKKKNLFWHTKVILCSISSTAVVRNVTSYLTVKSLPLLSPLELSLPAACQFNLFSSAGCYTTPNLFSYTESCFYTPCNIFTHSHAMLTELPTFVVVKKSEMVLSCAFCKKKKKKRLSITFFDSNTNYNTHSHVCTHMQTNAHTQTHTHWHANVNSQYQTSWWDVDLCVWLLWCRIGCPPKRLLHEYR